MSIGKISNKEVVTINQDANLYEAAQLMSKHNVGFIVATAENQKSPQGTLTDRDIVTRAIAKNYNLNDTKVSDIMSKDILTLDEKQGIYESIELMCKKGVRRAPIINDQRTLSGVVSVDDLAILLTKELNFLAEIPHSQIS